MALAALGTTVGAVIAEDVPSCAAPMTGPARTVARVLDGETVILDDGRELRLVGALDPRALDVDAEPGTWPAERAAQEVLRALVLGRSIELRFAGERTDRYGRLQAQAFLIEGDTRRWVQGTMLQHALARAYAVAGDATCREALLAAERAARQANRGLWAEAAYRIRSADDPLELLRYRTTYQVVQGRIASVAQTRGTVYLNFDRNWRQGFSVSLRRGDASLLGTFAGDPEALEGRLVQVRGWIEQRDAAPIIDLSAAGLIEVVDDVARPPGAVR